MHLLLSVILIAASALGSEWLVGGWLGEDTRFWVALAGIALMVISGALVKASGINALTRLLRNAMIGAGIGAALNRMGLRLSWLRGGLRMVGVETDPQTRSQDALRGIRLSGWLLWTGWAGSMVGLGLVWTGVFAG